MAFETAIYTDVTREEAVDGTDGFNFRSISAGLDGNHQRLIREHLLHHNSIRWPIEQDERDHPETAVFLRDGGDFYFSRGHATGATHNGRRGNQLTQAIVTADSEDVQPYLPAQVYAAKHWLFEKAEGNECARWFGPLEIDPSFEADALWDMLHDDQWMMQTLPMFITMLENASRDGAPQVVVVHEDLDTVMRWFALGTMLIDGEMAMQLEYRAFATDPFHTRAQLVGVSPKLDVGPLAGAHVIDIAKQTVTPIEVSESARVVMRWVETLDYYDAMEVIALARRWMPVLGERVGAAGAEMVTGQREHSASVNAGEWELGLQVIEGLAREGRSEELLLYFDELADAIASYRLTTSGDFTRAARAARFASASGISGLTEAVLLPSLESLSAACEHADVWARELNQDGLWKWPEVAEPAQIIEPMVQIMLEAPDEALLSLFPLIAPLHADRAIGERLKPALRRLAHYLMQHPHEAGQIKSDWFGRAQIERTLRRNLILAIEQTKHSKEFWAQLKSGIWDHLDSPTSGEGGLTDEMVSFSQWLASAKIARLPVESRARALERLKGKRRPGRESWEWVLQDAQLPMNVELYAAWISIVGPDDRLSEFLRKRFRSVCAKEPAQSNLGETKRWVFLAKAYRNAVPGDAVADALVGELVEYLEKVPNLVGKAKGKIDGFADMLKWKKKTEE